jgi:hypothetical protein
MADPFSWSAMTWAAVAAGTAATAGTVMQYQGLEQQAKAQKDANQYNQILAENESKIITQQTQANEEALRRRNIISTGQNIARASGGLTGSSLDILLDNAAQQEMDVLNLRYQANLDKTRLANQTALGNYQTRAVQAQTRTAQAGALLGGASKVAQIGFNANQ